MQNATRLGGTASGRTKKIVAIKANSDFSISMVFDNGEHRLLDVSSLVKDKGVLSHFSNISDFQRAYLDAKSCISWEINPDIDSNKVWTNKIDLDPDWCYMESVPN